MTTKPLDAKKPPKVRMTPKKWAEAETLWKLGEVTLDQLSSKFDVARSTLLRHFNAKGIKKGSRKEEHTKAVEATVTEASIAEAAVFAARIRETKEEHYKMAAALAKLTWNEVLQTKQKSLPFANALPNLKALDSAMNVLKKAREERWAVLGLDRPEAVDPDELPELVISELTAEQIQELRDKDIEEIETVEDTETTHSNANDLSDDEDEDDDDGVVSEG